MRRVQTWLASAMEAARALAPDDASQSALSRALSKEAGAFPGTGPYRASRMNSIVYPVHGGMEDWAYAASWDRSLAVRGGCAGYDRSRTASYDDASNRCSMILVETSKRKAGPVQGSDEHLLEAGGEGSNHVARNVRLALVAWDAGGGVVPRRACGRSSSTSCASRSRR